MQAKRDCHGKPVIEGTRVRWVGSRLNFTAGDHLQGYKDVPSGSCGNIVGINHPAGPEIVLVQFGSASSPLASCQSAARSV